MGGREWIGASNVPPPRHYLLPTSQISKIIMTLKLDTESLRYIAALENTTGAEVKDCIVDGNTIVYVIKQGNLGMAIGKGGANIKKLTTALGKKLHLVELHEDPVQFATNLLGGATAKSVTLKDDGQTKKIVIEADNKNRGTIVGKGGKNVEMIKSLLKRHHNVEDVVVR